jgi:hypothetical protein
MSADGRPATSTAADDITPGAAPDAPDSAALADADRAPVVVDVDEENEDDERERLTIAGHLIEYALLDYTFIRDSSGDIYALPVGGADTVARPLDELRYPLAAEYFRVHGKPPSTSAWPEAVQTLKGLHQDAPKHEVHLRHAFVGDVVVVDLCREDASVVEIDRDGWRIVERSPVIFRRTADMAEMSLPARGGSLDPIRQRWRISHERWGLVLGWLIIALLATLPAPVLVLLGEQGTGKSLLMKFLVKLVDAGAPIGRPPASEERLQNAALNHRVYCIDNVSHLQPWLSDALAALVTGESDKRRKLYTDADPFRLNLKAAVLITGITIEGAGPDLLERMVSISLDVIRGGERLHEAKLSADFDRELPFYLGALFDLVPPVLDVLMRIEPPEDLPRMADYALVLNALDRVIFAPEGASSFYRYYTAEVPQFTADEVIEGSEFATDLVNWFDERRRQPWTGTATELLKQVAVKRFDRSSGGAPRIPKSADYPRTPRGVTAALKRLAPVLRTLEITWTPPKPGRSHKARTHTISPMASGEILERTLRARADNRSETAPTALTAHLANTTNTGTGPFDHELANRPRQRVNSHQPQAAANAAQLDQPNEEAIEAVLLPHSAGNRNPANPGLLASETPLELPDADEIERLAELYRHYQQLERPDGHRAGN